MNKDTIGVRRMRARLGISMTALALKADVAPSTMSLVERGKRPSRRTAEKIAAVLGLAPLELWENYDELRPY